MLSLFENTLPQKTHCYAIIIETQIPNLSPVDFREYSLFTYFRCRIMGLLNDNNLFNRHGLTCLY
jgi:hypothetical protein